MIISKFGCNGFIVFLVSGEIGVIWSCLVFKKFSGVNLKGFYGKGWFIIVNDRVDLVIIRLLEF